MLYTLLVILVAVILAAVVINFVRSGGRASFVHARLEGCAPLGA